MHPKLADLHHGFRSSYLDYQALTAQLRAWAEAFPALCRLQSLGTTPEGRSQWLLAIGSEPERVRPAAWVDGNMHAVEVAGSSVALSMAEDMLELHLTGSAVGLPRPICERLRQILFYVVPRISPDGAEQVLQSAQFVRSVPRDERPNRGKPRWLRGDVDGDGLALSMRAEDPAGDYVESKQVPGLMLQRQIDDEGPYYKLYPEGTIEHFDGQNVPEYFFMDDNPIDLNRNFPWSWAPAHEQAGAGPFAASEPEARSIVEFATKHPEIFAWLNLHTYGGVAIRPLGDAPDSKMDQDDLALFRQIEQWTTEETGYPMVSGYEEFLYQPDKPLRGDLSEYAYQQRGAIAYVVELWDLFARMGLPRPKRFVDHYSRLSREDLVRMTEWDKTQNEGRVFRAWRPFRHPQLGEVGIGGLDPRIGIWNPSLAELDGVCVKQSRAYLRVASLAPLVQLGKVTQTQIGSGAQRVNVRIENRGYLPTTVLASAEKLDFNEPLYVDCEPDGLELVDPGQRHVSLGHLQGWGRGLHSGGNSPSHLSSKGSKNAAHVSYWVRGKGKLRLRFGSCRVGWIEETIAVG
jgi:hypothetical protein